MSRSGDRNLNLGSGNGDEKTGGRGICKCLVTQGIGEWIRSRERIRKRSRVKKQQQQQETKQNKNLSYLNLGERGTNNEIEKGRNGHQ